MKIRIFAALKKIQNMTSDNNKEMFPIVDEEGNITGAATRGECHNGSKLLHPVVHLHVFNSQGELFLQKRPEWKDIQPGKWDTSVFTPQPLTHYVFESDREKELVFSHRTTYDGTITPSEELDGGRFWTLEDIRNALGTGVFTPNFESEFKRLGF